MGKKGVIVLHTIGGKKRKMVHLKDHGEQFFEVAEFPGKELNEGVYVDFDVQKAVDGSGRQLSTQYAKINKKLSRSSYWSIGKI